MRRAQPLVSAAVARVPAPAAGYLSSWPAAPVRPTLLGAASLISNAECVTYKLRALVIFQECFW